MPYRPRSSPSSTPGGGIVMASAGGLSGHPQHPNSSQLATCDVSCPPYYHVILPNGQMEAPIMTPPTSATNQSGAAFVHFIPSPPPCSNSVIPPTYQSAPGPGYSTPANGHEVSHQPTPTPLPWAGVSPLPPFGPSSPFAPHVLSDYHSLLTTAKEDQSLYRSVYLFSPAFFFPCVSNPGVFFFSFQNFWE